MYAKNYSTARTVLNVVAFAGSGLILVGIITVILGFSGYGPNPMLLIPGVAIMGFGVVIIAMAQVSFAILNQADISLESLRVLRGIAEKQDVDVAMPQSGSPASATKVVSSKAGLEVHNYMGTQVVKKNGSYYFDGQEYPDLTAAEGAVRASQLKEAAAP